MMGLAILTLPYQTIKQQEMFEFEMSGKLALEDDVVPNISSKFNRHLRKRLGVKDHKETKPPEVSLSTPVTPNKSRSTEEAKPVLIPALSIVARVEVLSVTANQPFDFRLNASIFAPLSLGVFTTLRTLVLVKHVFYSLPPEIGQSIFLSSL